MKDGGRAWTAIAVPSLVVLALLAPVLARGQALLGYDFVVYNVPLLTLLGRAYERLRIPGWNPLCGLGQPFAADLSVAAYYPPYWLALVLSPVAALHVIVALHLVLGYAGTWHLARARRLSPLAAHVAALVHGLGGVQVGYIGNPALLFGTALLPWCVLVTTPALARGAPARRLALAAVPFALSYLGGAPESCALGALLALALGVADGASPWRAAGRLLAVGLFAMALGAVSLLPFLAGARGLNRAGGLEHAIASSWSLPPVELLGVATPGFLPLAPELEPGARETRPFHPVLFQGVVALALMAGAVAATWRRPATRALALVLVLALLYALGRHGPLYPLLWEVLPPVRYVRYPAKVLALSALAAALLAGTGLDASRRGALAARSAGAVLGLLAAGAAAWALAHGNASLAQRLALALAPALLVAVLLRPPSAPPSWARRGLVIALALELAVSAWLGVGLVPRALYSPAPPRFATRLHAEQRDREEPVRVMLLSDVTTGVRVDLDGAAALGAIQRAALSPNAGACWGLRSAEEMSSYTARRPELLRKELLRRRPPGLTSLRLHAVTHVVVLTEQLPSPEVEPIDVDGAIALARLQGAPAWAAVYPAAHAASDVDAALERVLTPGFAPDRECVVEGAGTPGAPGAAASSAAPVRARVAHETPDRIELEAEAAGDGAWLVVREAFAPGWTATVDGAPAPVHAADVVFRAVPLPRGRHVVVLSYEAGGRTAGARVSALAWLAVLAAAALELRARRAARSEPVLAARPAREV